MKKAGEISVLFDDGKLVVVNKPPFLPVHPGFNKNDFTLVSWLDKTFPPQGSVQLLNRIDKETSGIVLAGRGKEFVKHFNTKLFKDIYKEYVLLAKTTKKTIKEISFPLNNVYEPKSPKQTAVTKIISCKPLAHGVSLYHVTLQTGRTHQIRRHFQMAGAPVVGDWKYGDIELNKKFRKLCNLRRQFLHAYQVQVKGFPKVVAELAEDLQNVINILYR